jgi:hypothetical protein
MKQIWPNYSYSPTTNVLTLTGLNIDRDQLLLVSAPERGRIMYNFADSTVTASAFTAGANTGLTLVASTAGLTTTAALVIYYDDQLQSTAITVSSLPAISGTVTANVPVFADGYTAVTGIRVIGTGTDGTLRIQGIDLNNLPSNLEEGGKIPVSGTVTANIGNITSLVGGGYSALADLLANENIAVGELPAISGTVTANLGSALPAGTNQIGSVTASISGTVPVSISSVTVGNSVTIGSLPSLVAGTAQIGSVTASISNTVVTFYPAQGTAITNSNFTNLTPSTTLVSAVAGRDCLTVFNEGAGNLHISPSATCTTISYQVRLSTGDYWECPKGQLSLAHTAVFATAGTARVTEVS